MPRLLPFTSTPGLRWSPPSVWSEGCNWKSKIIEKKEKRRLGRGWRKRHRHSGNPTDYRGIQWIAPSKGGGQSVQDVLQEIANMAKKTKAVAKKSTTKEVVDTRDPYDILADQVQSSGSQRSDLWKPLPGKSTIRVFGFEHGGQTMFAVEDRSHYFASERKSFACTGVDCGICEWAKGQPDDIKKNWYPGRKFLFNAVLRDEEGDKVVIAQLPVSVVRGRTDDGSVAPDSLLGLAKAHKAFDLKNGRDVTIVRQGKNFNTRYSVSVAKKASPIGVTVKPTDLVQLLTKLRKPLDKEQTEDIVAKLDKKYER